MIFLIIGDGANCEDDFNELLISIKCMSDERLVVEEDLEEDLEHVMKHKTDLDDFSKIKIPANSYEEINLLENNGTSYVAGYFAFKLLKKHDCEECRNDFKNHTDTSSNTLYARLRQFQGIQTGGIFVPSDHWVNYIKQLEELLMPNFYQLMYEKNVLYKIFNILKDVETNFIKCKNFPKFYFLKLFIRIRLYYIILFANRTLKNKSKNQKYLKITNQI